MAYSGSRGHYHSSADHNMFYNRIEASNPLRWTYQYSTSDTTQCKVLLPSHMTNDWSINDEHLPQVNIYDKFHEWLDGDLKCIFQIDISNKKKCLKIGWPMRNSNNHKIDILKKSCVGVHRCSSCGVYVYPAISESARKSQTHCSSKSCKGKLLYLPCRGNNGHPVTHSWRRVGKSLYFEARGFHDHPKPVARVSRANRKKRNDSCSQPNPETSIQSSTISTSSRTCLPTAVSFPYLIPPTAINQPALTQHHIPCISTEASTGSSTSSFCQQQHIVSSYPQNYPIEYPQFPSRNSGNIQSDTSISDPSIPQRYSNSSSSNDPWSFNYNDRQTFYNSHVYPPNPDFTKHSPVYDSSVWKWPPTENSHIPSQTQNREYEDGQWRIGYGTN